MEEDIQTLADDPHYEENVKKIKEITAWITVITALGQWNLENGTVLLNKDRPEEFSLPTIGEMEVAVNAKVSVLMNTVHVESLKVEQSKSFGEVYEHLKIMKDSWLEFFRYRGCYEQVSLAEGKYWSWQYKVAKGSKNKKHIKQQCKDMNFRNSQPIPSVEDIAYNVHMDLSPWWNLRVLKVQDELDNTNIAIEAVNKMLSIELGMFNTFCSLTNGVIDVSTFQTLSGKKLHGQALNIHCKMNYVQFVDSADLECREQILESLLGIKLDVDEEVMDFTAFMMDHMHREQKECKRLIGKVEHHSYEMQLEYALNCVFTDAFRCYMQKKSGKNPEHDHEAYMQPIMNWVASGLVEHTCNSLYWICNDQFWDDITKHMKDMYILENWLEQNPRIVKAIINIADIKWLTENPSNEVDISALKDSEEIQGICYMWAFTTTTNDIKQAKVNASVQGVQAPAASAADVKKKTDSDAIQRIINTYRVIPVRGYRKFGAIADTTKLFDDIEKGNEQMSTHLLTDKTKKLKDNVMRKEMFIIDDSTVEKNSNVSVYKSNKFVPVTQAGNMTLIGQVQSNNWDVQVKNHSDNSNASITSGMYCYEISGRWGFSTQSYDTKCSYTVKVSEAVGTRIFDKQKGFATDNPVTESTFLDIGAFLAVKSAEPNWHHTMKFVADNYDEYRTFKSGRIKELDATKKEDYKKGYLFFQRFMRVMSSVFSRNGTFDAVKDITIAWCILFFKHQLWFKCPAIVNEISLCESKVNDELANYVPILKSYATTQGLFKTCSKSMDWYLTCIRMITSYRHTNCVDNKGDTPLPIGKIGYDDYPFYDQSVNSQLPIEVANDVKAYLNKPFSILYSAAKDQKTKGTTTMGAQDCSFYVDTTDPLIIALADNYKYDVYSGKLEDIAGLKVNNVVICLSGSKPKDMININANSQIAFAEDATNKTAEINKKNRERASGLDKTLSYTLQISAFDKWPNEMLFWGWQFSHKAPDASSLANAISSIQGDKPSAPLLLLNCIMYECAIPTPGVYQAKYFKDMTQIWKFYLRGLVVAHIEECLNCYVDPDIPRWGKSTIISKIEGDLVLRLAAMPPNVTRKGLHDAILLSWATMYPNMWGSDGVLGYSHAAHALHCNAVGSWTKDNFKWDQSALNMVNGTPRKTDTMV